MPTDKGNRVKSPRGPVTNKISNSISYPPRALIVIIKNYYLPLSLSLSVTFSLKNERKSQSKIRDLQERLDQSQATRKSLENYVNFLKSSYSSIFNETSVPAWKSPLTH